jgi:ubiquinone/menaquinone biosynthesis C-methylase UbiE
MRNPDHQMLPQPSAEDAARQRYVLALKAFVGRRLRPLNESIFTTEAKPDFEAQHGRAPESVADIAAAMYSNRRYQTWSTLNRTAQELMWQAVGETVLREEQRLKTDYRRLHESSSAGGSLQLDPDLEIPNVLAKINIHLQPGGYVRDNGDDDVIAGAFYEAGGAVYSRGQAIGVTESKAETIIRFIREHYAVTPRRILDVGCSAGASSTPYAEAFPEAEVHAIDVAPGLLRYAHARAEALGVPVHFHQRNAAAMGFEDNSFDLVVSHNAMHEMSGKTTAAMMRESFRLLRPGGVCVHQDVPLRFEGLSDFKRFDLGWDLKNNNEPFWEAYATNDCQAMLEAAGFRASQISIDNVPLPDSPMAWYVASALKT